MYEWNTAQNEPIMILMLWLLESMLSKPNINIIILFQKKSIHTLENNVLMHQCAISAKDIKQYIIWNFELRISRTSCDVELLNEKYYATSSLNNK